MKTEFFLDLHQKPDNKNWTCIWQTHLLLKYTYTASGKVNSLWQICLNLLARMEDPNCHGNLFFERFPPCKSSKNKSLAQINSFTDSIFRMLSKNALISSKNQQSLSNNWAATWQNQQNECVPSEDSDQPGHPPSLIRVFAVHMKKAWVLSYPLSALRRLWSDWANAQLICVFTWRTVTLLVCHVMAQLWTVPTIKNTNLCLVSLTILTSTWVKSIPSSWGNLSTKLELSSTGALVTGTSELNQWNR